jgi:hypothetical protein
MRTKAQVSADFRENILPGILEHYERDGIPDWPARSEAWNNYTDMLCKSGEISPRQYNTWVSPRCCGKNR